MEPQKDLATVCSELEEMGAECEKLKEISIYQKKNTGQEPSTGMNKYDAFSSTQVQSNYS